MSPLKFPERAGGVDGLSSVDCRRFAEWLEECVVSRRPLVTSDDLRSTGDSTAPSASFDHPWRSHRVQCAACAARWSEALLLDEAFSAWAARRPEAELTPGFADSVLARLASEPQDVDVVPSFITSAARQSSAERPTTSPRQTSVRSQRAIVAVVAGTLAALALMVATGRHASDSSAPQEPQTVSSGDAPSHGADDTTRRDGVRQVVAPAAIATNQPSVDPPVVAELLLDARAAYRTLAEDAADVVRDAAAIVAVRSPDSTASSPPADVSPEQKTLPFLPWTRQLENAVDFLWDAVPQADSPPI